MSDAGAAVRTFVLDTSVLLSDPRVLTRFAEHEVVLPVVVVTELEGKRHHSELGCSAREALRFLDDLRVRHGRLDSPLPLGEDGGTLRVELDHTDPSALPDGFRLGDADSRILAVAPHLTGQGRRVTVVSKDLPMCVEASAVGLHAEERQASGPVDTGWTGTVELDLPAAAMAELYSTEHLDLEEARELPCHTGLVLLSPRGSALARVTPDEQVRLVRGDREAFGVHGRSAEQRIALDLLLDPAIGVVSLGGRAGTDESALALCAGLEAVLERRQHHRVVVFRPLYAVGGQDLGHLPGSEAEEVLARGLHDAFVIVDEAQSLERNVLLTVLSRIGQDSRVVLTHDVAQRDDLRVGRHDGVAAVIEALKDHPLFAHVALTRSERSAVAALVTALLEGLDG